MVLFYKIEKKVVEWCQRLISACQFSPQKIEDRLKTEKRNH